ncbi:trehalose-6-phosphate synthase [Catenulispora sp. MAP5-51]
MSIIEESVEAPVPTDAHRRVPHPAVPNSRAGRLTSPRAFPVARATKGRGADFVVVANRLPVDLELLEDGTQRWHPSPGGLVSALEPFLRSRKGAWVGWSGQADLDVASFEDEGLSMHPVRLSAADIRDYYEGFSNATLWPLYHDVVVKPVFERAWWDSYVEVNRRFADAAAAAAGPGATVWVQDYQLQLVPAMLREKRPDLRIGFFLHIPFPLFPDRDCLFRREPDNADSPMSAFWR